MPSIQLCKAQEMQITCIYKAQRRLLFYLYLQHRANKYLHVETRNIAVNACTHIHIQILPNCNHHLKYMWMARCSCSIIVLLLFLKASVIQKRLTFAPISTWAESTKPNRAKQRSNKCMSKFILPRIRDAPASAAQLSRAQLEARDHSGINPLRNNCNCDST